MDTRRLPRAVTDPKVRQVGFFAATVPSPSSPPVYGISPSSNSLSPVMIPPPLYLSDQSRQVPLSSASDSVPLAVVSYNTSEFSSPALSGGEFSGDAPSSVSDRNGEKSINFPASGVTAVSVVNALPGSNERDGNSKPMKEKPSKAERRALQESQRAAKAAAKGKDGGKSVEAKEEQPGNSKPTKEKPSKAERRALQESQRAAKAAAKGMNSLAPSVASMAAASLVTSSSGQNGKATVVALEKKGNNLADKDRRRDVPHPRMQFDDQNRVEKGKKRSVVKQTEARNRVELFRHLPRYEYGTRLSDLELKFFHLDPIHPAVYKVGLSFLAGDMTGGNARCIAMLKAFQEFIKDYSTPPQKTLSRDLTAKINCHVSFLIECRPLAIGMGNTVRFLKTQITTIPLTMSEQDAKSLLLSEIDRFINEKILLADLNIAKHAVTKIRDGDVVLTYGLSSAVEMVLLHAHELGKRFRVVIVDSRPKFEGQILLRRLVGKGLTCTYTHINGVSYIMKEVSRVFLGASSVLSNGTVYSRDGTASVAMVAHQLNVPVLICCEAYKFHERELLDSICLNELGDPDALSKVAGRREINYLDDWANTENLQLLNLMYDATPSDYVSAIISEYGMIPPKSVPVIVRLEQSIGQRGLFVNSVEALTT